MISLDPRPFVVERALGLSGGRLERAVLQARQGRKMRKPPGPPQSGLGLDDGQDRKINPLSQGLCGRIYVKIRTIHMCVTSADFK